MTFRQLLESHWGASVALNVSQMKKDKKSNGNNGADHVYIPDELHPKKYKDKVKYTNIVPDERGLYFMWGKTEDDIKNDLKNVFKLSSKKINILINGE